MNYTTIGNLCSKIGDGLHGTPKYNSESSVPFINGVNLKGGKITITENTRYVDPEEVEGHSIDLSASDTLLLQINGTIGNMAFYNGEKIVLGKSAAYLRFKNSIDKFFCYYYLQLPNIIKGLYNVATGSTIKNLGLGHINDFRILKIGDVHKKGIVDTLATLDAKIDLNNRINAELETLARTIYDYWFLQFDFPDAEGRPYRSSGGEMTEELPTGWCTGNIMELSDLLGGGTPSKGRSEYWGGDIPFFTPTDAKGEVFCFSTDSNTTAEGIENCSSKLFEEGTIFITARGSVGRLAIAGVKMGMNQSCYALRPKPSVSPAYLFFKTENLIEHLKVKSSGSVFNSIVSNDIAWTLLSIPPFEIIEKFSAVVNPMFAQISTLSQENAELSALRDWLLPLLMSGEVRVRE